MQTYELSWTPGSIVSPLVVVTIIAGASAQSNVIEFAASVTSFTGAGNAALGVPAAKGTGSAGVALQPLDPSDAAAQTHLVAGAFATTQPTAPANPFRQFSWPGATAVGAGVTYGWDVGELVIPAGGQLVLWLLSGTVTMHGYVKVAEGG
jgi:hypothetical protein